MSNFFHTVLGRYNISDRWIGLDYGKLFLDPIQADITLAHEMVHGVLAMNEFGQASNVLIRLMPQMKHIDKEAQEEIGAYLVQSQIFVQEGFATLLEISQLRKLTGKKKALEWAQKNLPPDYLARFERLMFAFDLSQRYRDYFTSKISYLAMETEIRKDIPKYKLLESKEKIIEYLNNPDKNPDARLSKMIETLKYKGWLVTRSPQEIAQACEIPFYDPPTKEEVALFLNYVTSFTDKPSSFTAKDIGDTPQGVDAFTQVSDNMIIGNMNLNLAGTAMALFKTEDFIFHAKDMEIVFVSLHEGDWEYKDFIKVLSGSDDDPAISMTGFLKTGEKYMTAVSKEKAVEILNDSLKNSTMMVKWGAYDLIKGNLIWSEEARKPDIIIYNTPRDMLDKFKQLLSAKPEIKLSHLHAGASEDHPLQTLIIKIDKETPIHIVNTYGNRGIVDILSVVGKNSMVMSEPELRDNKKALNNILALWMNLHWEIDWVETMIDKETLIFRK